MSYECLHCWLFFSSSNLLHQLLYLCALLHSWRCYQEFVLQLRPLRRQGFSHVVHQRCFALHGQSVISDYMQILICMWMGHHLTIWWFFLNAIFVFPGYASQIRSHTSWQIHDHVSSHLKHIFHNLITFFVLTPIVCHDRTDWRLGIRPVHWWWLHLVLITSVFWWIWQYYNFICSWIISLVPVHSLLPLGIEEMLW